MRCFCNWWRLVYWVTIAVNISNIDVARAGDWKLSDDCRSVAKEDDLISVCADEALRRYTTCGPDKVVTYAKHGPCYDIPRLYTSKGTVRLPLDTKGCRYMIAAHCHSYQGRTCAVPGSDVDSAFELCQMYKKPVVGFRHEFNNFSDCPILPRIMCTQKIGEVVVPVADWDVWAYVPCEDGRINSVKVKHPQRLFPKLGLVDCIEKDPMDATKELVSTKPRSVEGIPQAASDCLDGPVLKGPPPVEIELPEVRVSIESVAGSGGGPPRAPGAGGPGTAPLKNSRFAKCAKIVGPAAECGFMAVEGLNCYSMAERNGASCPITEGVVCAAASACPVSNVSAIQESYYMAQERCSDGSHMMEYIPSRRAYLCKKDWESYRRGQYYRKTCSGWEEEGAGFDDFLIGIGNSIRCGCESVVNRISIGY